MLRQGGADKIPVRLKNAVLRILSRSLTKYRSYYLPSMPLPGQVRRVLSAGFARLGGLASPVQLREAANMHAGCPIILHTCLLHFSSHCLTCL